MSAQLLYEDGQGNVADERGNPEPMGYIVDQEQFVVETITSYTEYLEKTASVGSQSIAMQVDKPNSEDSHRKEVGEKREYVRYTCQDKARLFKLKIDKCLTALGAAKLLGIHVRTAQRWVKQYHERSDSIFDKSTRSGRRFILTTEHKQTVTDFIDANPSAAVIEVTEHFTKKYKDLQVSRSTVYSFMGLHCNLSLKKADFQFGETEDTGDTDEGVAGENAADNHQLKQKGRLAGRLIGSVLSSRAADSSSSGDNSNSNNSVSETSSSSSVSSTVR